VYRVVDINVSGAATSNKKKKKKTHDKAINHYNFIMLQGFTICHNPVAVSSRHSVIPLSEISLCP